MTFLGRYKIIYNFQKDNYLHVKEFIYFFSDDDDVKFEADDLLGSYHDPYR